jgi:hypothetical protein
MATMKKGSKKVLAKPNASPAELEAVELDPKAWPKFEALMKSAAKMGHKPHDAKLGKIARAKPKATKR